MKKKLLDLTKIPDHVAIIMDGNRRWAKSNGFSTLRGHKKGADNLIEVVRAAIDFNIKILTVYAFSTENWDRKENEVKALWRLFEEYLVKNEKEFLKLGLKLKVIGDITKCPKSLQKKILHATLATEKGTKITLVLAINYGARDEIKRAFKKILIDYDNKELKKENISEKLISSYLDTSSLKEPDLLIRTSGEMRLSNFLLWQLAYSELYVTKALWPDFSKLELKKALLDYQMRERRFGGL